MLQNARKIAKRFTQREALATLNHYNYLHNTCGLHYTGGYWSIRINGFRHRWRLIGV